MPEKIDPGFYEVSNEKYHAGLGISKTGLSKILRWSPAHYKAPDKETDAKRFGIIFHYAVLEPDKFGSRYTILPASCRPGSGKGMQERKDTFLQQAADRNLSVIKTEEYDLAMFMSEAVHKNQAAHELLTNGRSELSGYWYDPDRPDVLCKIRMDWYRNDQIIVDVKSTTDARYYPFKKSAYDNDYHMQGGFYTYGATQITKKIHKEFYFIAVEKKDPYGVQIYRAHEDFINQGMMDCQQALDIYEQCLKTNEWPCYNDLIKDLGLPDWLNKKNNMILD